MSNLFNRLIYVCAVFLMLMPLVSCSGGGGGTAGTGTLVLGLTDAHGDYEAVYVTIAEVQVKKQGEGEGVDGWDIVPDLDLPQTFNLLELVNGVIVPLGEAELPAGQYNQMRLILDEVKPELHPFANYLIKKGEQAPIKLEVPSGPQTGIKIVNGFTIESNQPTDLILDFDANKSIVQAGKSDNWLLKPTYKVLETVTYVRGTVFDQDDNVWIQGASVSAQIFTPPPSDPPLLGEVFVEGATVSDEWGDYFIHLPLFTVTDDPYNIVAEMEGFIPDCKEFHSIEDEDKVVDFYLTTATETGTFSASVSGLDTAEDSALFSIRQTIDCGSGLVAIEVASASVKNTMSPDPADLIYFDSITLPVLPEGETYEVVVSSGGETTQVIDVVVTDGVLEELDVVFP